MNKMNANGRIKSGVANTGHHCTLEMRQKKRLVWSIPVTITGPLLIIGLFTVSMADFFLK